MVTATAGDWSERVLAGGRYRVIAPIGYGGMSVVYLADDRSLDTQVVIKVPNASLLETPRFAFRFRREVRSLVKLSHPNVVKVLDVGDHEGVPYIVMQYLSGGSLAQQRRFGAGRKPLPCALSELRDWLGPIAGALDFIHTQGFIHRDVKPGNILFDAHHHAYLSDFGLAKVLEPDEPPTNHQPDDPDAPRTREGAVVGTLPYMAPELLVQDAFDGRVDQYALAVLTYEMITGRRPFEGDTKREVLVQHMVARPQPMESLVPTLNPAISRAVLKALAKDPNYRYPNCDAFARAVLAVALDDNAPLNITTSPAKSDATATAEAKMVAGGLLPGPSALCPACGARVQLSPAVRGRRVRCGLCKTRLLVHPDLSNLSLATDPVTVEHESPTIVLDLGSDLENENDPTRRESQTQSSSDDDAQEPEESAHNGIWIALAVVCLTILLAFGLALRWGWIGPRVNTIPNNTPTIARNDPPANDAATAHIKKTEPEPVVKPAPENPKTDQLPKTLINGMGMELVLIKPGTMMMGNNEGNSADGPARSVTISKPFYIGKFEVTVGQFRAFAEAAKYRTTAENVGGFTQESLRTNPSTPDRALTWQNPGFPITDNHPAVYIDYAAAEAFCRHLSQKEKPRVYRLPTEAEWEYACRAGTRTRFSFGDAWNDAPKYAWYQDHPLMEATLKSALARPNARSQEIPPTAAPLPVGKLAPNPFGLYDMHGNAAEWCRDVYQDRYHIITKPVDPVNTAQAPDNFGRLHHVLRGGAYVWREPDFFASASRVTEYPEGFGFDCAGFRIVAEVPDLAPAPEKSP